MSTDFPDHLKPPVDPGTFGQDFNYSVWSAGTEITLCNVPWNADYRDIVSFDSQKDLDTYLSDNAGPTVAFEQMTYARVGHPVRIPLPFNDAYRYNYLRVRNPRQPVGETSGRTFYYFIRDVRHLAPNTTELDIQLDVWQTFGREVTFGSCYVERGHVGIANSNDMADNGREYLTIPEGLDLGGEYRITANWNHQIVQNAMDADFVGREGYAVLVLTTVSLEGSGGNVENPDLETARGSMFEGLPNGAEIYYFEHASDFTQFMGKVSSRPWVSQGIISVQAIPRIPADQLKTETVSFDGLDVKRLRQFKVDPEKVTLRQDWRDHMRNLLPARYRHLSKFLTYPYMVVELTTYSGNPLLLKPESIGGNDLEIVKLMHLAPPAPRIAIYPYKYNDGGLSDEMSSGGLGGTGDVLFNDNAEFLDMQTGIMNLPTFSLVNNGYLSHLATQAHSIPYQYRAADWSQQRALAGNALAYDQASQNMALQRQMTGIQVSGMAQHTDLANTTGGYRAIQQGVNSVASGLMSGTPMGIVGGAIGAANAGIGHVIDVNHRNQTFAIDSSLANRRLGAQQNTAAFMRDSNREFADFAAQGDYEMAIAAINAKVQDAQMIQPTTSGQMGGDAFNLTQYAWRVHAKIKQLQPAAIHAIGEFWLRYGYRVGRFFTPPVNMQVMTRFTYWKLRETYVHSTTCPEMFRQAIRGIFEKGVTVWADPDYIGRIDIADNRPISGVSL